MAHREQEIKSEPLEHKHNPDHDIAHAIDLDLPPPKKDPNAQFDYHTRNRRFEIVDILSRNTRNTDQASSEAAV
jgi:hypothetical protein